jgi:chemotaxis protein MotB
MANDVAPIIIIKRVKKVSGGGHHGGAWKVAYADFVTAMMAFFLLLWLLGSTDEEKLEGLADYFQPTLATLRTNSGSDGMLGGTSLATDGSQSSGVTALDIQEAPPPEDSADEDFDSKISEFEDAQLTAAGEEIRKAIQDSVELSDHNDQLIIQQTPDGMRIEIVDKDQRSMFREGTDELHGYARTMIAEVAKVIEELPNRIAILGHTDSNTLAGDGDYTNWELSADRANSARRVLSKSDITNDRYSEVTGKAATEPIFPDSPFRAENRRITILVLREAPVLSPDFER